MGSIEFHTKVVGVTFTNSDGSKRQELIEDLDEQLREGGAVQLTLQREPNNPHDTNAVAVLDPRGRQLGYLTAKVCSQLAPLIDQGVRLNASVTRMTGDGMSQNSGVNIRVWSA